MKNRCLYLVSSSASKEYVADCLEALALPRGAIHHFRYRAIYLDGTLRALLASRPGHLAKPLRDLPIVVVYLYQEQTTIGAWKPAVTRSGGPYVPLRCGRLEEAYLEGDIAHFYFEVTDYVRPRVGHSTPRELLNDKIRFRVERDKGARSSYAHLGAQLQLGAKQSDDALAFQEFVSTAYRPSEWRTRSLGSMPLDVTYAVVFVRVAGLFVEKNNRLIPLQPELRPLVGNPVAEYQLKVGETYHLQIVTRLGTRLAAELPGQGNAVLRLTFDPSLFRASGTTEFGISSNYDLQYWSFVPLPSASQHTVLNIGCDHGRAADQDEFVRRELICPALSIPVSIVP
jgi:hypothetical protein